MLTIYAAYEKVKLQFDTFAPRCYFFKMNKQSQTEKFTLQGNIEQFKHDYPNYAEKILFLDSDRFTNSSDAINNIRSLLDDATSLKIPYKGKQKKIISGIKSPQKRRMLLAQKQFMNHAPAMVRVPNFWGWKTSAAMIIPANPNTKPLYFLAAFSVSKSNPKGWTLNSILVDAHKRAAYQDFVFHHEVAHGLAAVSGPLAAFAKAPITHNQTTYGECLSDAYASLRHIQKTGDVTLPKIIAAARSMGSFNNNYYGHHTFKAIDMAIESAIKITKSGQDFKNLKPEDIFLLSTKIARKTSLNAREEFLLKFVASIAPPRDMRQGISRAIRRYKWNPTKTVKFHAARYIESMSALMVPNKKDKKRLEKALIEAEKIRKIYDTLLLKETKDTIKSWQKLTKKLDRISLNRNRKSSTQPKPLTSR